jgi:hypothetical protein
MQLEYAAELLSRSERRHVGEATVVIRQSPVRLSSLTQIHERGVDDQVVVRRDHLRNRVRRKDRVQQRVVVVGREFDERFFQDVEDAQLDTLTNLGERTDVPVRGKKLSAVERHVQQAHEQREAGVLLLRQAAIHVELGFEELHQLRYAPFRIGGQHAGLFREHGRQNLIRHRPIDRFGGAGSEEEHRAWHGWNRRAL